MVSLSATTTRTDDVTLVTGRIDNPGRPRRVRVEHRLDGPVWPPRTEGVPAEGWDAEGFEWVLAADETRPFGYATPASPAEDPLAVVEAEPVDADAVDAGFEPRTAVPSVDTTAAGVVRALESPRPPRAAVPLPAVADGGCDPATDTDAGDAEAVDADAGGADAGEADPGDADAEGTDPGGTESRDEVSTRDPDRATPGAGAGDVQPTAAEGGSRTASEDGFESTLAAVEQRVAWADALSETATLAEAAEVAVAVGGVDGLRDLDEQLDADAARLRRLGERALALAERCEAADLPVETVERFR